MPPYNPGMLPVEETDNNIQNNRQQNRQQTGSDDGKVKDAAASFEANIPRQPSKRNPQSRSQVHSPSDQDQHNSANH